MKEETINKIKIMLSILKIILFILPYIIILYMFFFVYSPETLNFMTHEKTIHSQCISDSMGMIIDCRNDIKVKRVVDKDNLAIGNIYVYNSTVPNKTIIHRLILDCRLGCYGYIFKGDNNYGADEPVDKSKVLYEVKSIEYQ